MGLIELEDFLEVAGEKIDYVKITTPQILGHPEAWLKRKLVLYKRYSIQPYLDHGFFLRAYRKGLVDEAIEAAANLGFLVMEFMNTFGDIPENQIKDWCNRAIKNGMNIIYEHHPESGWRKTKKNAIGAFNELGHNKWNFIGKMGVLCGVLILSFYTVVAGWVLGYVIEMITGNFEISDNFGKYVNNIQNVFVYSILFMFFTALIVSRGVEKGIEKAAKILMPSLIIIILLLIIYALTLPNSIDGIIFYLVPDFSQINLTVAGNALGQAFFSLSLGMGMLITYGSYVDSKNNIINSAALITLTDVGIAFLSGLILSLIHI